MSILRERYSSIPHLVFESRDARKIFKCYLDEFFCTTADEFDFVAMFLNLIKDFIDQKFDENVLSGVIHASLFDERTKKYHYEPYLRSINDVLALLHELLDVAWTKGSAEYDTYLLELETRHLDLVKKYQQLKK